MLSKLLGRVIKTKNNINAEYVTLIDEIEKFVKQSDQYFGYYSRVSLKGCDAYERLKALPYPEKSDALIYLSNKTNSLQAKKGRGKGLYRYNSQSKDYYIDANILDALIRTKFEFGDDFSFTELFTIFYEQQRDKHERENISSRPLGGLIVLMEKHAKKHGLTEQLKKDINNILTDRVVIKYASGNDQSGYYAPDVRKWVRKLNHLLLENDNSARVPPYQLGTGNCGSLIAADINHMGEVDQDNWNALFHHLSSASTGKPTQKFIATANSLLDKIGHGKFKSYTNKWLNSLASMPVASTTITNTHNGHEYSYDNYEYIEHHSNNLLKGLLWSMSRFHDQQSLQSIAVLTEKCFQKIPGIGPASAGVGNAAIYALAQSKGLGGISHLSRLKLRIRQHNTQKLIQKYIDEQAKKQGIKPAQIEEIAASDYGLEDGVRTELFDNYQLKLRMTGIGATELQWIKPDGKPQKSVPAFVKTKTNLTDKLNKMRDLVKQIKQASTAQRDSIDRLYTEDMSWNLSDFDKYYLNHGLVSQIARKLIWTLDAQPMLYVDGDWQNEKGEIIKIGEQAQVHLWHPIESEANTVLAWRDRLEALKIQQPLKQAYREIYLLTDAEINTRIYSNRMAAHILKQHQFNSLAALRGWKYSLLGAYDDGRDGEIAEKVIPELNIKAQFWINEILDDTDSFNDAGIWYYVATDQVRFCNENDQAIPLVDVPPLILSEIMRDVDLFVGVASVGNDPQWQDGGPEGRQDYRNYWHSYSFGDLTEVAKTRKTVLERLLPRLKIRDVATIEGKFLVVQGNKNKYKIHIGSGNILIAPNDRYLCIVPGRGKDKNVTQLFLPFEGDNGLSIVLSKAFLLADDDNIDDPTILSQL